LLFSYEEEVCLPLFNCFLPIKSLLNFCKTKNIIFLSINIDFFFIYPYIYGEDKLKEIKMKKVVLSLVIGGLSISGDCFAARDNLTTKNSSMRNTRHQVVKTTKSKAVNKTVEILNNRNVQIALGTAAVIGSGVAAYYFVPGVSNFVNSNAKTVINVVKNSDQYKFVSSKLLDLGKTIKSSDAFKTIANSKVGSWLGIKPIVPAPTKWQRFTNGAANTWNSIPSWTKWTAAGVTGGAVGWYYAFPLILGFQYLVKGSGCLFPVITSSYWINTGITY